MKNINFFKSDDISNVRLQKYFKIFTEQNFDFKFYGWKRSENSAKFKYETNAYYLIQGGGYGNKKKLLLKYLKFVALLFIYIIRHNKRIKNSENIAVNFDAALVFYLTKFLTKATYIYEVHDSFALSYKMPTLLRNFIMKVDRNIMKNAKFVIHVDKNRIVDEHHKNVIIYNSPLDYFNNKFKKRNLELSFAIIGNISEGRGIKSILSFAKDNPQIEFVVIGKFYDLQLQNLVTKLQNITYYDYLPQIELFEKIAHCCGIFSLYDPSLEINRLAASNKVYDAMMLGIPVITNPEVQNSNFIVSEEIGVIVSYKYDKSWEILAGNDFLNRSKTLGTKGRILFEKEYEFQKMVDEKLIERLK